MFAKVFGQIFDSSIAEDYNCRRMFMDLLVLADPTGAVDMTHEAISRRTNVPESEVRKYIGQLCQPDSKSRSKMEDGKRLVPLDKNRDWGWQIVNYQHYRRLKDEEARRSYFRDAQRKARAKKKKAEVQEEVEEEVNVCSTLSKCVKDKFTEWMAVRRGMGKKPKSWDNMFTEQVKWLKQFTETDQIEVLSASIRGNWQGLFPPNRNGQQKTRPKERAPSYPKMTEKREPTEAEIANARRIAHEETARFKEQFK
jgi:hypothetical protein